MTISRRVITTALTEACVSYWAHKGYSLFKELGLAKWGKMRADVLAINLYGHVVQLEVKSSTADYRTDTKWQTYLPFSNRMYFVMLPKVYKLLSTKLKEDGVFDLGIGVMVLDEKTGYLRVVRKAKYRKMAGKEKKMLVFRMVWRNGISKRTNPRRVRQFITEEAQDVC